MVGRRCVRRSGFGPGLLVLGHLLGISGDVGGVQGGDGGNRDFPQVVVVLFMVGLVDRAE